MNRSKYVHFIILIIFFTSCNEVPEKKENVVRVAYEEVRLESFRFPKRASGTLSTSEEFRLSFKTGGIIKTIAVKEGQKVSNGALLASLDLSEIEANENQAKAAVEKARRDYDRTNSLFKDSVATKEQLQNAKTALEVAEYQFKIAQYNLRHSQIVAPENGTILKILKEENELVSPGYPILLFGSTKDNWIFNVNVTDKDLIEIEVGDSATVSFDAWPSDNFPGVVTAISKGADPYTNTYKTEVTLEPNTKYLASGFIGIAYIYPKATLELPVISYETLLEGDELTGTVIILKNDTTIERRQIEIKKLLDDGIVVSSGLEKNEKLITEGLHYIDNDTKIKIVE